MLLIDTKKGLKVYTIKNKYLCECGVLNEKKCMQRLHKIHEKKVG